MGAKSSKKISSTPSNRADTATQSFSTTAGITTTRAAFNVRHSRRRVALNYLLVWVDASNDETSKDFQKTLEKLKNVVADVEIFKQTRQCIAFLNDIDVEKVFVITSGSLGPSLVPNIHSMSQVDSIYICCDDISRHKLWTKEWKKIRGVYDDIKLLCAALQVTVNQCNRDSIGVDFVTENESSSTQSLNQPEPSFIYTQIFKEIFLEIKYDKQTITELAAYCREKYQNPRNEKQLNDIAQFEREYHSKVAIQWYTRECFLYHMLNRAFRLLEIDTIIKMGFFIRDLHRQIQQRYQTQIGANKTKLLTVYRRQYLSKTEFEKLCRRKNSLMFFNSFLSTTRNEKVAVNWHRNEPKKSDMVDILFVMYIDPSVAFSSFADIQDISYQPQEEEILLLTHTVFRIARIKQPDSVNQFYQVDLRLTVEVDKQLRRLTKPIRNEIRGTTAQSRLGKLLLEIGQFDEAENWIKKLLKQMPSEDEKALYYDQLGYVKNEQHDYRNAIQYYKKSFEIRRKTLPPNHPDFATTYNNIAGVYDRIKEYSTALSYYEKSFEINKKTLPPNHRYFATYYNNIASVYYSMNNYSKALSFYEKALEIDQQSHWTNYPNLNLATSYNNMGLMYKNMSEYSKALSFYKKSLEIYEKTLFPNHPVFSTSYSNIASLYYNMNYSKALSYYKRALEILEISLPEDHPNIRNLQNLINLLEEKLQV